MKSMRTLMRMQAASRLRLQRAVWYWGSLTMLGAEPQKLMVGSINLEREKVIVYVTLQVLPADAPAPEGFANGDSENEAPTDG